MRTENGMKLQALPTSVEQKKSYLRYNKPIRCILWRQARHHRALRAIIMHELVAVFLELSHVMYELISLGQSRSVLLDT